MKAPQADPGPICPLHKCDVSKVCHKCAWYVQIRGKNPQTGADMDDWYCSIAFLPMALLEVANRTRGTTVAVESMRDETVKTSAMAAQAIISTIANVEQPPRLINGKG